MQIANGLVNSVWGAARVSGEGQDGRGAGGEEEEGEERGWWTDGQVNRQILGALVEDPENEVETVAARGKEEEQVSSRTRAQAVSVCPSLSSGPSTGLTQQVHVNALVCA